MIDNGTYMEYTSLRKAGSLWSGNGTVAVWYYDHDCSSFFDFSLLLFMRLARFFLSLSVVSLASLFSSQHCCISFPMPRNNWGEGEREMEREGGGIKCISTGTCVIHASERIILGVCTMCIHKNPGNS